MKKAGKRTADQRTDIRRGKLDHEQKLQICWWLAETRTPGQVEKLCLSEWKIKIGRENIRRNYLLRPKWKKIISDMRDVFLKELLKIPIANKAVRLLYRERIYKEAMTWYRAGCDRFGKPILKLCLGAANDACDGAMKEMQSGTMEDAAGEGAGRLELPDIHIYVDMRGVKAYENQLHQETDDSPMPFDGQPKQTGIVRRGKGRR